MCNSKHLMDLESVVWSAPLCCNLSVSILQFPSLCKWPDLPTYYYLQQQQQHSNTKNTFDILTRIKNYLEINSSSRSH